MRVLAKILTLAAVLGLAAGADAGEPPRLTVVNWDGAAGAGYRIVVGGARVVIEGQSSTGKDWVELWRTTLEDDERRRLAEVVHAAPFDRLEDDYRHPDVEDGTMFRFHVPAAGGEREIRVNNILLEELVPLTEALDEIVPEKFRLRYRERFEALEREIEALGWDPGGV